MKFCNTVLIALLMAPCAWASLPTCNPIYGPVSISTHVQTVFNYQTDACPVQGGDYSDNPVRPFLVGPINHPTVMWFASNSKGYFKTVGVNGHGDILSSMQRVRVNGQCVRWLTSRFNTTPNQYPVASYNNELWMVAPYTTDGIHVYALVHNEYHIIPRNTTDVYGNLIAAHSEDGANTFQLYNNPKNQTYNVPVIVAPYPYAFTGKGGMFAQSNIIHWGSYYYALVYQGFNQIIPNAPLHSTGVCIYRTNNLANPRSWLGWNGHGYQLPLRPPHICTPVLPAFYRFSWSYNTALHHFIIIGIDRRYMLREAFVYTLADLNAVTGQLSPAGHAYTEYLLRPINWVDVWKQQGTVMAQTYPSLLDPTSPRLLPGDRNFQFSGVRPYIYYTLFYPRSDNHGRHRDVVRQQLTVTHCTL